MIPRIARISTATLLALLLILPPRLSFACGPDFTGPTFTNVTSPDDNNSFARGKLGILQRGYYHLYLFEAYRNLAGKPFTKEELAAFGLSEPTSSQQAAATNANLPENWITTWQTMRANLLGQKRNASNSVPDPTGITRAFMRDQLYLSYYNCLRGAFENAVHTLQSRVSQFGAQNPLIKEWIAAQDQVFENCSVGNGYPAPEKAAVIPVAARTEDPAILRADRAYQIAAALFYAGQLDDAQRAFEGIAKDTNSPYRAIAPYLIARVLIRKATLDAPDDQYDIAGLGKAEAQLDAVLAGENSAEYHIAAQRLLNFLRIRLHRKERFHELESELSAPASSKNLNQDLTDYLWLLDRPVLTKTVAIAPATDGKPEQKGVTTDEDSRLQAGDMTDWIFTFHEDGENAYQHSRERWQKTNSLPWLVSSLAHATVTSDRVSDLIANAAKVSPDSPAYVTVTFHRLRLLEQSGLHDAARRGADALLAQPPSSLPPSARNQLRALRMKLATNLSDLLQFAPRVSTDAAQIAPLKPGEQDYPPGSPEYAASRPHFDADASVILTEKLPLHLLADAAKSNGLPASLRADIAVAAWTRAIQLQQDATARELAPVLAELVPELKADLDAYAAASAGSREFAAIAAILRNPGLRPFVSASPGRGWFYSTEQGGTHFSSIDNFGDNWWCAFSQARNPNYSGGFYYMFSHLTPPVQDIYTGGVVAEPDFLSAPDKAAARDEFAALVALPSGPRWLGSIALAWANAHPDDPRVPEALHNIVRAWRYGCSGPEDPQSQAANAPNYSKDAFEFLHKHYPDNEWTKKTPYWFN